MTSRLTHAEQVEAYTGIANRLADWINNEAPKSLDVAKSLDVGPVYDAHVLLCELIREFERMPPEIPHDR